MNKEGSSREGGRDPQKRFVSLKVLKKVNEKFYKDQIFATDPNTTITKFIQADGVLASISPSFHLSVWFRI